MALPSSLVVFNPVLPPTFFINFPHMLLSSSCPHSSYPFSVPPVTIPLVDSSNPCRKTSPFADYAYKVGAESAVVKNQDNPT
ncbi:hypothetical protein Cni_G03739 [Canna indica]|uniref:Uncharacterized protein n=1 Tax=Canna indica TaxID=4628 RepID=A0AAQ3Q3S7_9LILI|nr:hypothetical protein Cni_G03739 [Canna indica]